MQHPRLVCYEIESRAGASSTAGVGPASIISLPGKSQPDRAGCVHQSKLMVLEHHFQLLPSVTDTSGDWGPSSSGITLILVDTVHPISPDSGHRPATPPATESKSTLLI